MEYISKTFTNLIITETHTSGFWRLKAEISMETKGLAQFLNTIMHINTKIHNFIQYIVRGRSN